MMVKPMNLAVVGIDTAVGAAVIELLEKEDFTLDNLLPVVTALDEDDPDAKTAVKVKGETYNVETIDECTWEQVEVAIFCLDHSDTQKWAHIASDAGVTVIDTSQAFADSPTVAVLQDQITPRDYIAPGSIVRTAEPVAAILASLLQPIHNELGVEQVSVTAMLSASHAGKAGVSELAGETARLLNGLPAEPKLFPAQTAFNLIPVIGTQEADGYSQLEHNVIRDLSLLIGDESIKSSVTAIQVPLFYGYGLSVELTTRIPVDVEEVQALLSVQTDMRLFSGEEYPTAVTDMLESDEIMVSRLRQAEDNDSQLACWILADNIKVATALNAIKLAQSLGMVLM